MLNLIVLTGVHATRAKTKSGHFKVASTVPRDPITDTSEPVYYLRGPSLTLLVGLQEAFSAYAKIEITQFLKKACRLGIFKSASLASAACYLLTPFRFFEHATFDKGYKGQS
eukprot:6186777-Pleurochrysis_carterae.AAC.2